MSQSKSIWHRYYFIVSRCPLFFLTARFWCMFRIVSDFHKTMNLKLYPMYWNWSLFILLFTCINLVQCLFVMNLNAFVFLSLRCFLPAATKTKRSELKLVFCSLSVSNANCLSYAQLENLAVNKRKITEICISRERNSFVSLSFACRIIIEWAANYGNCLQLERII